MEYEVCNDAASSANITSYLERVCFRTAVDDVAADVCLMCHVEVRDKPHDAGGAEDGEDERPSGLCGNNACPDLHDDNLE